jgi:hypothetical protein
MYLYYTYKENNLNISWIPRLAEQHPSLSCPWLVEPQHLSLSCPWLVEPQWQIDFPPAANCSWIPKTSGKKSWITWSQPFRLDQFLTVNTASGDCRNIVWKWSLDQDNISSLNNWSQLLCQPVVGRQGSPTELTPAVGGHLRSWPLP